jgi:hypothetical protein
MNDREAGLASEVTCDVRRHSDWPRSDGESAGHTSLKRAVHIHPALAEGFLGLTVSAKPAD